MLWSSFGVKTEDGWSSYVLDKTCVVVQFDWLNDNHESLLMCFIIEYFVCRFVHPHTEKEMYFAAETPDDFLRILSELRMLGEENAL